MADGRVFTGRQAVDLKLIDAARRRAGRDRLAGQGEAHRRQDAGARLSARRRGSATCRSCTSRRSALLDAVGLGGARPSGSRMRARCRRSNGSTLTVCWRFGTLRRAIEAGGMSGRGKEAGADDQVRAGAADLDAEPASLSARRREHRQRHPQRDHRRAWRAATGSSCAASAPSR